MAATPFMQPLLFKVGRPSVLLFRWLEAADEESFGNPRTTRRLEIPSAKSHQPEIL